MSWWSSNPRLRDTVDRVWRTWLQAFLGTGVYTGIETNFNQVHWVTSAQSATIITLFTLAFALVSIPLPVGDPHTVGTVSLKPSKKGSAR